MSEDNIKDVTHLIIILIVAMGSLTFAEWQNSPLAGFSIFCFLLTLCGVGEDIRSELKCLRKELSEERNRRVKEGEAQ